MKESVWYWAGQNEILVKTTRNRVERGAQALIPVLGLNFSVPDYLCLFDFRIEPKKWKIALKKGWLIPIGYL